ncbi:MAG: 4-hydroxybenzoate octaprenyltransferase, partial [Gammaproteobacteria bacterium]|nr:4-hydroxybenzoate octaprenyltransferase [Gammaproteobacteria bacterium]
RTRDRPLATGEVTPSEALVLFVALLLGAGALVLTMNALTIRLAFVGALLAATYPFMKRYTYLPQVHLGAAFGWAIPMAFAAQTGTTPPLAWLLYLAGLLWPIAYDTEYAMVDREDDLRIGVKSTAILFGDADRLLIGVVQGLLLLDLLLIGQQAKLHWPYFFALAIAALCFAHQQYLLRDREPDACFRAFLLNNRVGLCVFVGIAASYAL